MKEFEKGGFPNNSELFIHGDNIAEFVGEIGKPIHAGNDTIVKAVKEAAEKEVKKWTTNA